MHETNKESANNLQLQRSTAISIVLAIAFLFAFGGLIALGIWQVERRAWKLDLIGRVEARVHASPVAAPNPSAWPAITAARNEYQHIRLHGHFLAGKNTRVQAVSALGAGFWLLTPFQTDDGSVVLVNRGFVPPHWQDEADVPTQSAVTGLLRLSETKGGFLRANDPIANRWYSRDVAAIAAARDLQNVAPYFVDEDVGLVAGGSLAADNVAAPTSFPRGGLTVIRFANNHLGYALTWFGLALMVAIAGAYVCREEYRRRRAPQSAAKSP